jgi:quinoprotein dehydrogenase-associated probable ABC transporter substrate-binding protein
MRRTGAIAAGLLLGATCALGADVKEFRVCADPENLPFSNQKLEGFENKIAAMIADDLGAPLRYIWWGQRRGFIRNTMNATLKEGRCDIMIGAPEGYDLVRTTKPYYRSTYVFVYRKDKGFQLKTLDDPILKKIKIGVHILGEDYSNPPPVHELAKRGVVENVVGFDTFYSSRNPPSAIIDAVADGKIDAAIVWGPAAGYFVLHQAVPMAMVPIPSQKGDLPFAFDISVGVKKGDDALFDRVEKALDRKRTAIAAVLAEYGVPSPGLAALQPRAAAAVSPSNEIYNSVYNGWKWWHVYCYRCHGTNAVGTTLAPNLTDPNEKMPLQEFRQIVKTGSADGQMQAWNKLLDDKQIAQLYAYVRARADKVLPAGRPDEVGPKGGSWVPPAGWSPQR